MFMKKTTISVALLNGELTMTVQERAHLPIEIPYPSIISPLPSPPEHLIVFFPKDIPTLNSNLSLGSSGNLPGIATVKSFFVLPARGRTCLNHRNGYFSQPFYFARAQKIFFSQLSSFTTCLALDLVWYGRPF